MRKIFFDTEFTGLHQDTTLISIGFVTKHNQCEDTFYAELTDYDKLQLDPWLIKNVVVNLSLDSLNGTEEQVYNNGLCTSDQTRVHGDSSLVAKRLFYWLKPLGDVEMWSDTLAYDWVLFNQLWGHAFSIPQNVYYIPFDIATMFKLGGIDPDISREEFAQMTDGAQKHNALWDARVIKACFEKLSTMERVTP